MASQKMKPAKLVNGFIERFTKEPFEQIHFYHGAVESWLSSRGLTKKTESKHGFVSLADFQSLVQAPLLAGKADHYPEVTEAFQKAIDFMEKNDCDFMIFE